MVKLIEDQLLDEPLWAVLLEARRDGERFQILVMPPAEPAKYRQIGSQYKGLGRYMRRTIKPGGGAAAPWKWYEGQMSQMTTRLRSTIETTIENDWEWVPPAPMPVKEEEYTMTIWGDQKTPQTLVRHLDEWLESNRGYRLTGPADAV